MQKDEIKKIQEEIVTLKKTDKKVAEKDSIKESLVTKDLELRGKVKSVNDLSNKMSESNKLVLDSENLIKAFETFYNSTTLSTDNKPPMLLDALQREYIKYGKISHIMYLKICSKGGEAMTIKKPLSLGGGDTSYISGITISYILAQTKGKVEAAGTLGDLACLNYKLGTELEEPAEIRYILKPDRVRDTKKKHFWSR